MAEGLATSSSYAIDFVRRAPVTMFLASLMVGVFVYQWASALPGYDYRSGAGRIPYLMQTYGITPGAIRAGEWWRLVTAGFLHASLLHIALNMWGLLYAAPFVERWYGAARLVAIFLAAVVVGDIAAALTSSGRTVTVGASGGIIGLFAAMIVVGMRFWSRRDEIARGALPLMATLVNGLAHPGISNAGHVGGAIGGFIIAWSFGIQRSMRTTTLRTEATELARSSDREMLMREPSAAEVADPRNTITLRLGRRWSALTLGTSVAAFGTAAIAGFNQWREPGIAGAVGALFCVGWGIASLVHVRRACLLLTPVGFQMRGLFSRGARWRDVSPRFGAGSTGVVGAVFYQMRPEVEAARRGVGLLGGRTQSVPATFGLSATAQARLMAETCAKWSLRVYTDGPASE